MRSPVFLLVALAVGPATFLGFRMVQNDYVFFAGYIVLQYIVLATAWNILGGYCGYVNFGTAAFFALGAYSTVAIYKLKEVSFCLFGFCPVSIPVPDSIKVLPVLILVGGAVSGIVGLGTG